MHFSTTFTVLSLISASLLPIVASHGYLTYPPPRGIQKESYQIDDLKSPDRKGMCRGEPVGQITPVTPGGSVTLKFHITAPHKGPCAVYLLDANLGNSKQLAQKMDCAAPGQGQPWTIKLPSGVSGHQVLRWTWEGQHVTPSEHYEQCMDVNFGGSGSGPAPTNSGGDGGDDEEPKQQQGGQNKQNYDNNGSSNNNSPQGNNNQADSNDKKPTFGRQGPPPAQQNDSTEEDDQQTPAQPNYQSGGPSTTNSNNNSGGVNYDAGNPSTGNQDGGACQNGQYQCQGDKFAQCSNGRLYVQSCASGTVCKPTNGGGIVCANANAQL